MNNPRLAFKLMYWGIFSMFALVFLLSLIFFFQGVVSGQPGLLHLSVLIWSASLFLWLLASKLKIRIRKTAFMLTMMILVFSTFLFALIATREQGFQALIPVINLTLFAVVAGVLKYKLR